MLLELEVLIFLWGTHLAEGTLFGAEGDPQQQRELWKAITTFACV